MRISYRTKSYCIAVGFSHRLVTKIATQKIVLRLVFQCDSFGRVDFYCIVPAEVPSQTCGFATKPRQGVATFRKFLLRKGLILTVSW